MAARAARACASALLAGVGGAAVAALVAEAAVTAGEELEERATLRGDAEVGAGDRALRLLAHVAATAEIDGAEAALEVGQHVGREPAPAHADEVEPTDVVAVG